MSKCHGIYRAQHWQFTPIESMNAHGIGYGGLEGVSWLPAAEPFQFSATLKERLLVLGRALFALYDAVAVCYPESEEVRRLLLYRKPDRIPELTEQRRVQIIRPDIVLVEDGKGDFLPKVVELESAPAGQGENVAMQAAYGLAPEMVTAYRDYLAGRPYIVVMSREWSEYLWDQAILCKALRDHGVDAHILFNAPLSQVHEEAQQRWKFPPELNGSVWSTDLLGRIKRRGWDFIQGDDALSYSPGEAVVFRFGYFENFSAPQLERMQEWQRQGAAFLNPFQFFVETKMLLNMLVPSAVREYLKEQHGEWVLKVLDDSVAETWPAHTKPTILDELRKQWVIKFAAWDGDNSSWGARSVEFGRSYGRKKWEEVVSRYLELPWPSVLQRYVPSAEFEVDYVKHNTIECMEKARVRLCPFFLRKEDGDILYAGGDLTLCYGTLKIHGGTNAVMGPVSLLS